MVLFQIDILQKTTKIYEDDKRSMKYELETREQKLQREQTDKKRMEQRMHGVVTDTQHKWAKECVSCSSNNTDAGPLALCVPQLSLSGKSWILVFVQTIIGEIGTWQSVVLSFNTLPLAV